MVIWIWDFWSRLFSPVLSCLYELAFHTHYPSLCYIPDNEIPNRITFFPNDMSATQVPDFVSGFGVWDGWLLACCNCTLSLQIPLILRVRLVTQTLFAVFAEGKQNSETWITNIRSLKPGSLRNPAPCSVGRVVQTARTDGNVGEDLVRRRLTKWLMLLKLSRILKAATVQFVLVKFA